MYIILVHTLLKVCIDTFYCGKNVVYEGTTVLFGSKFNVFQTVFLALMY